MEESLQVRNSNICICASEVNV